MTDNEIMREKTFSEELHYFKERIGEVFDNYDNPNGNEDPLCISVLRDSERIVRKADEEINRQQAEIEQLKFEIAKLLPKGCPYAIQVEVSNKLEAQIKSEAIKEFADRLKENITDCHTVSDGEYVGYDWTDITHCIDNLIKEMVVDAERHKLIFKR